MTTLSRTFAFVALWIFHLSGKLIAFYRTRHTRADTLGNDFDEKLKLQSYGLQCG